MYFKYYNHNKKFNFIVKNDKKIEDTNYDIYDLTFIDIKNIENPENVRLLSFREAELYNMPNINKFTNLTHLDLSYSRINNYNDKLDNLTTLINLNVRNYSIPKNIDFIYNNPNLQYLNLSSNLSYDVEKIDFSYLNNLKINNIELTDIPCGLYKCIKLEYIKMVNSNLDYLNLSYFPYLNCNNKIFKYR